MPFLARVFRIKDSHTPKKTKAPVVEDNGPSKPKWTDAWQRTEVSPEEVQDLLRGCTQELKARGRFPLSFLPFLSGPLTSMPLRRHFAISTFFTSLIIVMLSPQQVSKHLSSYYLSGQAPTPALHVHSSATTSIKPCKKAPLPKEMP